MSRIVLEKSVELLQQGQPADAGERCRSLLADDPSDIEALFLLGNAAAACGDWLGAIEAFRRACSILPGIPVLLANLGLALQEAAKQHPPVQGVSLAEAEACLLEALAIQPDYPKTWENLGLVRRDQGRLDEAKECMLNGLAHDPSEVHLWLQLAALHVATYHFDLARSCYRRVLQLNPEDPAEILNRLATLQVYLGESPRALLTFADAIARATIPEQKRAYIQNRLFTLHYPYEITPEQIAEEHRQWGKQYFLPSSRSRFATTPVPDRQLRIGFVSPDFRMNAVAFFIQPFLAAHSPELCQVYCYANVDKPDIVTQQLQRHPVVWRDIHGVDDEAACRLMRDDMIDILVDLAGHGANNRLPLFALRPAPIQVSWIGYPDTTGLPAMDYRITDAIADPPGLTEHLHTEELIRLSPCFLCYRPGDDFPEPSPSPVIGQGVISFGTMSNFSKINRFMLEIWAGILASVPGSRLVLRYRGGEHERIRRELAEFLQERGIADERLVLLGHATSVYQQLQGYDEIDIALDTFPYNGTTTTCEALYMGVPVISLAGPTHVSRVGASLLHTVGLPGFAVTSVEEYRAAALALAADVPLLMGLRRTLRDQMLASPLCDGPAAARGVERLFRHIWRRWCMEQRDVTE